MNVKNRQKAFDLHFSPQKSQFFRGRCLASFSTIHRQVQVVRVVKGTLVFWILVLLQVCCNSALYTSPRDVHTVQCLSQAIPQHALVVLVRQRDAMYMTCGWYFYVSFFSSICVLCHSILNSGLLSIASLSIQAISIYPLSIPGNPNQSTTNSRLLARSIDKGLCC